MLAQAKNDEIIALLLLLLAEIISFLALRPSQDQQDAGKELVSHVINRRIKVRERSACGNSSCLLSLLSGSISLKPYATVIA